MKKAVGHLIPFMEKEREERLAQMGVGSDDDDLSVSLQYLLWPFLRVYHLNYCYNSKVAAKFCSHDFYTVQLIGSENNEMLCLPSVCEMKVTFVQLLIQGVFLYFRAVTMELSS